MPQRVGARSSYEAVVVAAGPTDCSGHRARPGGIVHAARRRRTAARRWLSLAGPDAAWLFARQLLHGAPARPCISHRRRHQRRHRRPEAALRDPLASLDPYATPARDVFICSSSTPPGGGVHGMCGYWAARSALSRVFGQRGRRATREWEDVSSERLVDAASVAERRLSRWASAEPSWSALPGHGQGARAETRFLLLV